MPTEPGLPSGKPRLVIVGSPRAQREPTAPLLRLTRDFARLFRMYEVHATGETAAAILGTGFYEENDVRRHRDGGDGGITQLAAMIARREVAAAILFLDPGDPWSDAVDNRALARVCIKRQTRLITTYSAALRWVTFEAEERARDLRVTEPKWKPGNWKEGKPNVDDRGEFRQLPIEERSVALISHDGKKRQMVDFLNDAKRLALLGRHQRILATGTTGWLMKLLFCEDPGQYHDLVREREGRLAEVIAKILEEKEEATIPDKKAFDKLLRRLRELVRERNRDFADRLMPLPSGPDGGDVIAGDEILKNQLHEVIFFHDTDMSHPHGADIRLFERTSRLPGVFSECVSDPQSAEQWIEGLAHEADGAPHTPAIAQQLRSRYRLREVVLVDREENTDGDELGAMLARACAGFVHHWMESIDRERELRIGVSWGWGMQQVFAQLTSMKDAGLLQRGDPPRKTSWSPIIGIIYAEMSDQEAGDIASAFAKFYGGELQRLGCAAFAPETHGIPDDMRKIVTNLATADLILTSGSPWDANASLAKHTGLDPAKLPRFEDAEAAICGVFLDGNGREVQGAYRIVGLGYADFQKAAANGSVVLMCGGKRRNHAVLSALRAKMVSVLITTRQTAEWVLKQPETAPPRETTRNIRDDAG